MATVLKPIYVLNPTIKNAAGEEIKNLANGSTTIYAAAVLAPPKQSNGSPGPVDPTCNYKSEFKFEIDRFPFPIRPSFNLTKDVDVNTPVEVIMNLSPAQFDILKSFDDDLTSQAANIIAKYSKLPFEAKSSVMPLKTLNDGRIIDASLSARIKGWSEYMTPGEPRLIAGVSYPGDPKWADVPTTTALPKKATVFYMKGPASVGGAFARTARPNRHLGPQDMRANSVSAHVYVYVSHVWVRTVKNNTAIQYGVTYAVSAMYMEPRSSIQSNPMGVRMYDPTIDTDTTGFNAASESAGYSHYMNHAEDDNETSPPRPATKRAREE
jgi:hypothetical protein